MSFEVYLENILSNLTIDDLPNEELKDVAAFSDMTTVISLMKHCKGLHFNIPKNCFDQFKRDYIFESYDGSMSSVRRMALELDMTQRHIQAILSGAGINETDEYKQLTIIEELTKIEQNV